MKKNLLLVLFGISGMTALIYEIIWIRPLTLVFGTTVYAVSTIVASFILGLAVGSWIAGKYSDRLQHPLKYFAIMQIAVGFYGVLLLPVFDVLPESYLNLYHVMYPNQVAFTIFQIIMAMGIIAIPATLMGTTLPLMMKAYSTEFLKIGKDVGKLDASNSVGAFFGTLAAGFLIIPILGIHSGIIVTASINITLGIAILISKKYLNYKLISLIVIAAIPVLMFYPSYDVTNLSNGMFFLLSPNYTIEMYNENVNKKEVLFYEESLYQNVMVSSIDNEFLVLNLDGKPQCNSMNRVTGGLYNMAFYPSNIYAINHGPPKTGLNIGLGCGTTSDALSHNMNTTTIEIDPEVVNANKLFYESIDHRLIIDDARNWLLRNGEKFDVITTEPNEPFRNWSLYTLEYYEILAKSTTKNGVVAQWIPVYLLNGDDLMIMYNTFHTVFPYVYVFEMEPGKGSQLIFVGSQNELKTTGAYGYLFSQDDVESFPTRLNTDDNSIIEFSTANSLFQRHSEPIKFYFNNEAATKRMNSLR